jgi:hypothetical protein
MHFGLERVNFAAMRAEIGEERRNETSLLLCGDQNAERARRGTR